MDRLLPRSLKFQIYHPKPVIRPVNPQIDMLPENPDPGDRLGPPDPTRGSNNRPPHEAFVKRVFNLIIEKDEEGWFVGNVPELPGCHTQAKTVEDLKKRIHEAILLYLETEGGTAPRIQFVGVDRIEVNS